MKTIQQRVERAFAPDITIARPKWAGAFTYNLVTQRPLFFQLCKEAEIERVTEGTIDRFLSAAGARGLTVETIDERES
jgi:hypothetical protein